MEGRRFATQSLSSGLSYKSLYLSTCSNRRKIVSSKLAILIILVLASISLRIRFLTSTEFSIFKWPQNLDIWWYLSESAFLPDETWYLFLF